MKNNFDSAVENTLTNEFSWLDSFENPYSDYVFSSKFENNIKKILPKAEFNYVSLGKRRVRKLFIAALAAVLALAATGCTFAIHYIVKWNETQNDKQGTLDITFDSNDFQENKDNAPPILDVPEGYEIIEQISDDFTYYIEYAHPNGNLISFDRSNALENLSISIDNEDSELKEITINEYKGYTYVKENVNIIYWTDSMCFYVLQGTCEMDILLKMAESVNSGQSSQ